MKFRLNREWPLIIIVFAPLVYLGVVWNTLGERVPMHWNFEGEVDRWGSKTELAIFTLAIPLFIYVLLLIIPSIDPKKRLEQMGRKWDRMRMVILLAMATLSMYMIYTAKHEVLVERKFIFVFSGLLFAGLGNYIQTVKPNYFIGIRTPWTLEYESIWRSTHRLGGRLWVLVGIVLIALPFLINDRLALKITCYTLIGIAVLVPVGHSYLEYRSIDQKE